MDEVETAKHRLELIRMARELANEEYINKRAEDHNAWLANVDIVWRAKGVKLPYPPFVPYPTEAEIVARAITLYNFVNPNKPATATPVDTTSALPQQTVVDAKLPTLEQIEETNRRLSSWDTFTDPKIEVASLVGIPVELPVVEEQVVEAQVVEEQVVEEQVEVEPVEEQVEVEPVEPVTGIRSLIGLGWLQKKQSSDTGATQ